MGRLMSLSLWLYGLLLWLYPADFRREYAPLMKQLFRDQCRTVTGIGGWGRLWLRILPDLAASLWMEQMEHWRRSHMERPRALIWLLPGLIGTGLFFFQRDTLSFYIWIGGIGIVGLALHRLGLIRAPLELKLAGYGGLLMLATLAAMLSLYLPSLGLGIWVLLLIRLRQIGQLKGQQGKLLGLVFLSTGVWGVLRFINVPDESGLLAVFGQVLFVGSWSLQAAMPALAGMLWPGRFGRAMVLPSVFALGATYTFYDPGYFTFEMSSLITFTTVLFPLVLCPAWFLLAREHRAGRRGLLVLWAVMLFSSILMANYARTVMLALPYENMWTNLERLASVVPHFFGLWLALAVYDRAETKPELNAVNAAAPVSSVDEQGEDRLFAH